MSTTRDENLGVIHLTTTISRKRNPKRSKKSNFVRDRLTAEDKKSIKFEAMYPLYEMWCEYYLEMVGDGTKPPDDRMLKADYHGAMLMVTEASNPTMVGITGIVCLETRYTFQLITKENKYVVIPKQGSVFQFILDRRVFTLFGDALKYKPALRGKRARLRGKLAIFLR